MQFSGPLFDNVAGLQPKHKRAMVATGKVVEQEGVSWMRSNAPWTDRTGNARNGLSGKTIVATNEVVVVFYHSVPYGIYLEVKQSGRYQVILPAIQIMSRRWFELLKATIFKGP